MTANKEQCPTPQIPAQLAAQLADAEPEAQVEVQRRGGKVYETFAEICVSPIIGETAQMVSAAVAKSVEDEGAAYFAVVLDGVPTKDRVSWYAYAPKHIVEPEGVTGQGQMEARCLHMVDFTLAALHKTVNSIPTLMDTTIELVRTTAEQQNETHKVLREAAVEAADVQIAALEEERKSTREAMIAQFAKQYLEGKQVAQNGAMKLQQTVCVLLDRADYVELMKHDAGRALFDATSGIGFRDAAVQLLKLVNAGDITLGSDSIERLTPWITEQLQGAGA